MSPLMIFSSPSWSLYRYPILSRGRLLCVSRLPVLTLWHGVCRQREAKGEAAETGSIGVGPDAPVFNLLLKKARGVVMAPFTSMQIPVSVCQGQKRLWTLCGGDQIVLARPAHEARGGKGAICLKCYGAKLRWTRMYAY
jgi:hypothetical protein